MRYHWGLAVGHVYVRDVPSTTANEVLEQRDRAEVDGDDDDSENAETENVEETVESVHDSDSASAPEGSESGSDVEDNYDDDEFLARYEMYGDSEDVEYYE